MNSWIRTDDFFPYWMNDHLEFQNPQPINRRKQYFVGRNWLIARGRLRPEGSLQIAGLMSKLPDLPRTLNCKQSGMRFGNVWYLDVGSQAVTCWHTAKSWPQFFWRAVFSSHCAIGWYGAELKYLNIWQRTTRRWKTIIHRQCMDETGKMRRFPPATNRFLLVGWEAATFIVCTKLIAILLCISFAFCIVGKEKFQSDSCHLNGLKPYTSTRHHCKKSRDVFVGYAKEGHNERDILLATSWKTSCVLDGCTHTRGGKLEEWDCVVTTIWEQCCSYWYLKMIWRNSLFQISKLPCCNQLWKVWPFCCCQSAKFLTPTALLLKTIRLERIDSSRDHFFTRLRTTWQKHTLQRPGCASWDSSFVFPVLEGFWGGFKEKPVRLTNI